MREERESESKGWERERERVERKKENLREIDRRW